MPSQKSHRSLKIVVKFQSEALHGGCCVSPSYRNRCFHTEQPGCLMGCFKGHCFSVIRGGSPEIHHAGPASTMQELRCSGATDSPLSDQLELQNCGFSFDLRTKETGFFIIGTFLESLIIGIYMSNSPTFPNWKLPESISKWTLDGLLTDKQEKIRWEVCLQGQARFSAKLFNRLLPSTTYRRIGGQTFSHALVQEPTRWDLREEWSIKNKHKNIEIQLFGCFCLCRWLKSSATSTKDLFSYCRKVRVNPLTCTLRYFLIKIFFFKVSIFIFVSLFWNNG